MVDNVVCREAGLGDRKAVLAINDNVYDGLDYLPSFYTSYIQDKWIRSYVAEVNGKVVSFIAHFITDGGLNMISGGSRTCRSHQKMGINQRLSKFAVQQTGMRFPQLQTLYTAGHYQPYADKVEAGLVPGFTVVRRMNYLVYDAAHDDLHSTANNKDMSFDKYKPITSQVEEILLSTPNRATLFHEGIIKVQANWQILAPTDDNIKKAVRCSFAVITRDVDDDSVLAVSFGSVVSTNKFAFSYDFDLFIDKSKDVGGSERHELCMSHIGVHAGHAADISGHSDKVALELSLPQDVDYEAVRQSLKPYLGENLATEEFKHQSNYILRSAYPKD